MMTGFYFYGLAVLYVCVLAPLFYAMKEAILRVLVRWRQDGDDYTTAKHHHTCKSKLVKVQVLSQTFSSSSSYAFSPGEYSVR